MTSNGLNGYGARKTPMSTCMTSPMRLVTRSSSGEQNDGTRRIPATEGLDDRCAFKTSAPCYHRQPQRATRAVSEHAKLHGGLALPIP